MPLEEVSFPHGLPGDIHLVPGLSSPRLADMILARYSDPPMTANVVLPQQGAKVSFLPRFVAPTPSAGRVSAHGVTVDTATGEVTVDSVPPGSRLRTFFLLASITEKDSSTPFWTARFRIHLHSAVVRLRLTPATLTVRDGTDHMRLSVLADFDDGVIGDVSCWAPPAPFTSGAKPFVSWAGTEEPVLSWSTAGPAVVDVHPTTGVLRTALAEGSTTITVVAAPPPTPLAGQTQTATAKVESADSWSTPTTATRIGRWAEERAGDVAHVLILPDGFTKAEGERAAFEKLAADAVNRLRTRSVLRPFGMLPINYFIAWVPSRDDGISVLNELRRTENVNAQAVPLPVPTTSTADPWTLENLVDEVGLPAAARRFDVALGDGTKGKLHDWQQIFGSRVTRQQVTSPTIDDGQPDPMWTVYDEWLQFSDRVLAVEKDTAFHMAFAERPDVESMTESRVIRPNARRITDADLDLFLGALVVDGLPPGARKPEWATGGHDAGNVVILCRSLRDGGANKRRTSSTAVGEAHTIGLSVGGRRNHFVVNTSAGVGTYGDDMPGDAPTALWTTMAHELAHSWRLDDEYAEHEPVPVSLVDQVNTQDRSSLAPGGGAIVAGKIKWQWPRVQRAGVIAAGPDKVADRVHVTMHPGSTVRKGDVVRLRNRPLPGSTASGRWKVEKVLADGSTLQLKPLETTKLDDALAFTVAERSIVVVPLREDDPDAVGERYGPDLTLIDPGVLAWITDHGQPLNAAPGSTSARPWAAEGIDQQLPTPARNIPRSELRFPPTYKSWIVGLFEEGARARRDVYRPTGTCLMRTSRIPEKGFQQEPVPPAQQFVVAFCPVCRYALVDHLDPTLHGAIDAVYPNRF